MREEVVEQATVFRGQRDPVTVAYQARVREIQRELAKNES